MEGEFIDVDQNDMGTEFILKVSLITKEDFENLNGHGIVHDSYKDLYFELKLFIIPNDTNKKEISLKNLKAYGTPYSYGNHAGIIIIPMISKNNPIIEGSIVHILEVNYKETMENPVQKYYVNLKYKE